MLEVALVPQEDQGDLPHHVFDPLHPVLQVQERLFPCDVANDYRPGGSIEVCVVDALDIRLAHDVGDQKSDLRGQRGYRVGDIEHLLGRLGTEGHDVPVVELVVDELP